MIFTSRPSRRNPCFLNGFAVAFLFTLSEAAIAADNAGPAAIPQSGFGHALFGFVIVLAVMAGAFWLLRRMQRAGLGGGSGPLRMVGAIAVGPKERVVLVECNGAWVLVGTAPGRVTSLHAMSAPAGTAGSIPDTAATPNGAGPEASPQLFRRWLEQALRQGKTSQP